MPVASHARRRITPRIRRQFARVRRLREESATWIRAAFGQARDTARSHIRRVTQEYRQELARRRADDEQATVSLVTMAGLLVLLRGPYRRAVSQAALAAQAATIASQTQAINAGQDDGWQQIEQIAGDVAVTAGIIALSRYGQSGYNGEPLSSYYADMADQAWEKAETGAMAAAANGVAADDLAALLESGFDSTASRALLIDETEIMLGYRDGLFANYAANPALVVAWQWSAFGPNPCPTCENKNGQVFPMEEEFDSHPRCFPAGVMVSGPRATGSTARWYIGEMIEIETARGYFLPVTPNHPILTPEGWVSAGALAEGGYVISYSGSEGSATASIIDPNDYQAPALIEQVAVSFGGAFPMSAKRMPTAAEDFHGDGKGSQVHIVRAYRQLRRDFDSAILEPFRQQQFCWRHMAKTLLAGEGDLALMNRLVGGRDVPQAGR